MSDRTRVLAFPEPTTTIRPAGVANPRPDGCPRCLARDNLPREVRWTPDGTSCYATYRCHTCGHDWWTGWATEPAGVA